MAQDREDYTTPIGVAVYPHLHAPDTKFSNGGPGVYTTRVRFTGEAADEIVELLDAQYAQSYEEAVAEMMDKKSIKEKAARAKIKEGPEPYKMELDEDGEETGAVVVNFKMKAGGTRKDGTPWTRKPALFDGQGQPVAMGLKIGSGSKLRIATDINRYYMPAIGAGVSLRLNAVQIIELQTWASGPSAEQAGFGAVEGGFSATDVDESAFAGTPEGSPEQSDDTDDTDDSDESDGGDF